MLSDIILEDIKNNYVEYDLRIHLAELAKSLENLECPEVKHALAIAEIKSSRMFEVYEVALRIYGGDVEFEYINEYINYLANRVVEEGVPLDDLLEMESVCWEVYE